MYLDIAADGPERLRTARDTISAQLIRAKIGTDALLLRQKDGFLAANPAGGNQLANFAERVLPARSVANLYPMNYSGKTDPNGFFIGRDRFGSNIIVDMDRRAADKTNASALILGNTGQGKSFLLKLLLCNVREAGKSVISLDSEHEMEDECRALGGCFLDYLSGQYRINLLEPRCWDDGSGPEDPDAPAAFRGTLLSQHISFLRDVFRVYGVAGGSEGWIPGADMPFIGADGFCSPIGSGWERRVTSEFGNRIDPITGQRRGHTGMDLAVPTSTPIRAALPGTVTVSKYNAGGYGYYVMIDHGSGLVTLYGHCSQLLARVGQTVQAGDIIALSGSTGRSTGPHLHFEVRVNGERTNPRAYLPKG